MTALPRKGVWNFAYRDRAAETAESVESQTPFLGNREPATALPPVAEPAGAGEAPNPGLIHGDDGMISLAAVIGTLIVVVMIGFLGNCIRAVQQRIEIQNAADAAAFSSSLWMARGMNAVTACNHLIGELSALCVLHEAIGGPELDEDEEPDTEETKTLNIFIKIGRNFASDVIPLDSTLLENACDTISDDDEKAIGAATLYDSRMTLKWITAQALVGKLIAKILEKIPILQALAPPIHIACSLLIAECYKEYLLLRYLQKVASFLVKPKHLLEDQVVPLMARYSKTMADRGLGGSGIASPLASQIRRTLDELKRRNNVDLAIAPAARRLALPIEPEPEPKNGSGGKIPSNYSGSNWPAPLESLFKLMDAVRDIKSYIDKVGKFIGISIPGPLNDELEKWTNISNMRPASDGSVQNPTRKKVESLKADWDDESTTQWTRATYPYVDSGRAPVVSTLGGVAFVPLSKAPTWYIHWTNRFTLVKTWQFRKGERFGSGRSADPLLLYVMRDSKPLARGHEPWTNDSRRAEQDFTLVGLAQRDVSTLFSPNVYKSPEPKSWVASAQAMFYNANEQRPGNSGSKGTTQPVVGWNTLNWENPGQVPEYGAPPSEDSGSDWLPWSGFQRGWKNPPAVKLNWQAKLVPVTRTRLTDSQSEPELPQKFRKPLSETIPFTSSLDAH
jgi:hypothetical protein